MRHIESERSRLQQRMAELETKVQDVTDIRKQMRRHPMLLPGSVIAASFLLAAAFRRR